MGWCQSGDEKHKSATYASGRRSRSMLPAEIVRRPLEVELSEGSEETAWKKMSVAQRGAEGGNARVT